MLSRGKESGSAARTTPVIACSLADDFGAFDPLDATVCSYVARSAFRLTGAQWPRQDMRQEGQRQRRIGSVIARGVKCSQRHLSCEKRALELLMSRTLNIQASNLETNRRPEPILLSATCFWPDPGDGAGAGAGAGGWSRTEGAEASGMDRQTPRDSVRRYNHDGVGGLSNAKRSGRPVALSADQLEELKAPVLAVRDRALHGSIGWRCLDECTVGNTLQLMDCSRAPITPGRMAPPSRLQKRPASQVRKVRPPSTTSSCPVMKSASSDASSNAPRAMSMGWPSRRSAAFFSQTSRISGLSKLVRVMPL